MTVATPFQNISHSFTRLFIFGCGGFGREVAWLAEQVCGSTKEIAFVVDRPEYLCPPVNGYGVQLLANVKNFPPARFVVALGNPAQRRNAVAACLAGGLEPTTLVHPRAEISKWIQLGEGVVICAGCILTTNITVGAYAQINLDCTIGHDVTIGEFTTLSPGVHVSGHVHLGSDVFIGTGASVINGSADSPLVIGDGAVIAAGACVTCSVEPGALVAGVPAMRKR